MSPDEATALLRQVNAETNTLSYEMVASDDAADIWADAPAPGHAWECRDYTVAKAKRLRDAGFPPADMSVVLCWIEPEPPPANPAAPPVRQYHAVLACRVGADLWVLDNRAPAIYRWQEPPYDYLWARQQIAGTTEFRDVSRTGLA